MAEEIQITGTDQQAKIRNPLAPALLPYITLGVYFWVWYYKINKELAAMGRQRNTDELGTSPVTSLLAVTFGAIIIVPAFLSIYNTWKRTAIAERYCGISGLEPALGFIITLFISPVGHYLLQRDLNRVLEAQAGRPVEGALPLQGGQVPPPPPVQPQAPASPPAGQPQAPPPPPPPAQ